MQNFFVGCVDFYPNASNNVMDFIFQVICTIIKQRSSIILVMQVNYQKVLQDLEVC